MFDKKIIIGLSIGLLLFLTACSSGTKNYGPGEYDTFAQCLTEKGVIMYGTDWCPHCNNQKESFGDSFQYIEFVDCDKFRSSCTREGIKGYPTWIINGEHYTGEQSMGKLSEISGCEFVKNQI